MHAGARIIDVEHSIADNSWTITEAARFTEHRSMNYASAVQPPPFTNASRLFGAHDSLELADERKNRRDHTSGKIRLSCVSTSFYDRKLCAWDFWMPDQGSDGKPVSALPVDEGHAVSFDGDSDIPCSDGDATAFEDELAWISSCAESGPVWFPERGPGTDLSHPVLKADLADAGTAGNDSVKSREAHANVAGNIEAFGSHEVETAHRPREGRIGHSNGCHSQ